MYKRKAQNSARVDMPRDLQMLLPDVVFWRCSCNDQVSYVQPAARMRPSWRFCAARWQ